MEADMKDGKKYIRLPATSTQRPFRCEVCQRSFREIATLRKHEQLHRADRPYVCNTCGKSFLWSSNLKVHERVHTGERPYKCKICHRCFTQSNDLRRHERNVHMRGKLHSSKVPNPRPAGHVNLATYQAFALQQRALLQHALTYESILQNVAVTQARYFHERPQGPSTMSVSDPADLTVSTSARCSTSSVQPSTPKPPSPETNNNKRFKLEQVTPPTSPRESHDQQQQAHHGSLTVSSRQEERFHQSPEQSRYSPTSHASSSIIQSPPPCPLPHTFGLQNGLPRYNKSIEWRNGQTSPGNLTRAQNHSMGYQYASNSSDSVMDLSINKSTSSIDSEDGEWKGGNSSIMSKSLDSESEYEEKRDVTTTSTNPVADEGIHHCLHCNIIFNDYTMFHLHQSLHSPLEEDPFRCPSCLKQCQDRIEFMFHIVWHVKYPNTIPNYQPFKESCLGDQ
ncbi:hypothetical protein CHS0354_025712 [Potamilus streckersoni]|uniref:C2H2-type domain-containing protein n=1 Tax=Potamilus streckersoni TaxID=2493646 RepID=A0AAE0S1F0_9BIVA|nr:hypothetical protein CHS0354_025712 [Potamilus streckersoni]